MADLNAFRDLLTDWNSRMNLVGPSALDDSGAATPGTAPSCCARARGPDLGRPRRRRRVSGPGAGDPAQGPSRAPRSIWWRAWPSAAASWRRWSTRSACRPRSTMPAPRTLALKVDVVTARACAPLVRLLGLCLALPCSGRDRAVPQGPRRRGRDAEARQDLGVSCSTLIRSLSDPSGRIVQLKRVTRVRPG